MSMVDPKLLFEDADEFCDCEDDVPFGSPERQNEMVKYSTSELYYMLEGDTTVSRYFLVENPDVVAWIKRCADGFITYETLLDKVNEEF